MNSSADETPTQAGDLYAELISDHLDRQTDRKASLEQRGLAVISTAGVLVTLQFALAAVALDRDNFELHVVDRIALGASLLLFISAAVLGLSVNNTRSYTNVSTRQLEELTDKSLWEGSAADAKRRIARSKVSQLKRARKQNSYKAKLLRYAILSEVGAVAFLAIGVAVIIVRS